MFDERIAQTTGTRGPRTRLDAGPALLPDDADSTVTASLARLSRADAASAMRWLATLRYRRERLAGTVLTLDLVVAWLALLLAARGLPPSALAVGAGVILLCWPVAHSFAGLYRTSWNGALLAPLRAGPAIVVAACGGAGVIKLLGLSVPHGLFLRFVACDILLAMTLRLVLRAALPRRLLVRRVLVAGSGDLLREASRLIAVRAVPGLHLAGIIELTAAPDAHLDILPGGAETPARERPWPDLPRLVRELEVDTVLIALEAHEGPHANRLMSALAHLPVQVYLVPDLDSLTARPMTDRIGHMLAIGLNECGLSDGEARLKRLLDLVIAAVALLVLWPLLLVIAIAIRLDSPGPALFLQERVGQHNRRFTIFKFRTMYTGAERRAAEHILQSDDGLVHKRPGDPRITRVGALLRRSSLDELPQLFNVLLGEMSVVGPRPELPWLVEQYHDWQYQRLQLPQGITGWWQVNGRSERVLHLHTEDDLYYVRNYSLRLDLRILLLTIRSVLSGRGAF
jgi:exopolysaccharide biosynthesis polyprenyl glycosylphosphotransferase